MQAVEVQLRKFRLRNPAADAQLLATRCSLRTCCAAPSEPCRSPSKKIAFYHVPRQQASGCYDPQGVLFPRWELADRAPGMVEWIMDDLDNLTPAELRLVGVRCQQLLEKARINV